MISFFVGLGETGLGGGVGGGDGMGEGAGVGGGAGVGAGAGAPPLFIFLLRELK